MMKFSIYLSLIFVLLSCNKELEPLEAQTLADYIEANASLELADLVACAGGKESGLLGSVANPTDVMFYPIEGATDFRYFEAQNVADSSNFSKYIEKDMNSEPILNGYLWKFNNEPFAGERMGVVTYKTPGKLHVCTPIRQKTNIKPTEVNPDLASIQENGLTPSFTWTDGLIDENVILRIPIQILPSKLIRPINSS